MTKRINVAASDRLFHEVSHRHAVRPMVCGLYLALDRAPDRGALSARIAEGVRAHPRLGMRLGASWRGPFWEAGSAPELRTLALSDLATHADFIAYVSTRMHERLPEDEPPWQLHAVSLDGGRRHGLWLRWQHTLSDGEGMLDLVSALCDDSDLDLTTLPSTFSMDRKPRADGGRPRFALAKQLLRLTQRGRAAPTDGRGVGSAAFTTREVPLGFSHADLLATAHRHHATTNDVLVALAALAWARWRRSGEGLVNQEARAPEGRSGLVNHEARAPEGRSGLVNQEARAPEGRSGLVNHEARRSGLRVVSPVTARREARVEIGNLSRALRLDLDLAEEQPLGPLIEAVAARSAAAMSGGDGAAALPYWFFRLVFALPPRVLDRALAAAPPLIVNYLPWAATPQRIGGATVTALHGFTPMLPYHGCTFAFTSYAGRVACALASDPALLGDDAALASCLATASRQTAMA